MRQLKYRLLRIIDRSRLKMRIVMGKLVRTKIPKKKVITVKSRFNEHRRLIHA